MKNLIQFPKGIFDQILTGMIFESLNTLVLFVPNNLKILLMLWVNLSDLSEQLFLLLFGVDRIGRY